MRRTRVKVCCIASPDEAQMATAAGADLLGLVGPMPSGAGIITLERAAAIARAAPGPARPVLLTSATGAEAILAEATAVGVATVQVVSPIDRAAAESLARADIDYIQVLHVEDAGVLDLLDRYAGLPDAFLLDSGRPAAGELGGTGRVHDWALSRVVVARALRPVYLAGGLTPANVGKALRSVRPHGVDLCTGIRTEGALDAGLLHAFMAAVAESDAAIAGGATTA